MNIKQELLGLSFLVMLLSCSKSDLAEQPIPSTTDSPELKASCPQQTVHVSALATTGGGPSWNCTGQLTTVWKRCYSQFNLKCTAPSTYYSVTNSVGCWTYTALAVNSNGIYFTYQDQRDIIDAVKAAALASIPSCPSGGQMQLVDLFFCEDPNFPDVGFCAGAKYACCVTN